MGIRLVLVLITVISCCGFAKEIPYTVPGDVIVFDVWKYFDQEHIESIGERADALYFITSLQGIANRESPRLYLLTSLALMDVETKYNYKLIGTKDKNVTQLDKFWFDEFEKQGYFKGRNVKTLISLSELVDCFKQQIHGLVLWDMKVPATSNVALMAAGCENLLPVSKDLADGSFCNRIKKSMPDLQIKLDLTNRFDGKRQIVVDGNAFATTGSAKNDAYKYAIEKYLRPGRTNPFRMWFNCDASMWGRLRVFYGGEPYKFLGDKSELQHNGMYNCDYWVAQRAVCYDLLPWGDCTPADEPNQPVGADNKTWHDMLEISYKERRGEFGVVGGFVPWWLKYTDYTGEKHAPVPTEWEFVSMLTSYNMGNNGDAAFGLANASFFQHLPAVSAEAAKFRHAAPVEYDGNTTYVAFMMMDYDGSAWLNQIIPSVYNDPARGKLPLNWCINPALNFCVPHAIKYMYDNRTDNDYFGFSCDGVAYIQPDSLFNRNGRIKECGAPYYEKFAKQLDNRYGIKYNIYYIDAHFKKEWTEMAARITPDGFGYNLPIEQQLINGTPVTYAALFHVSGEPPLKDWLEKIYTENTAKTKKSEAQFYAARCIVIRPSVIYATLTEVQHKYPDAKVKIIDIDNFFKLLKVKLSVAARKAK